MRKKKKKKRYTRSQASKEPNTHLFLATDYTHEINNDHLRVPRFQHGPRRLRYNRRREAPEAKAKINVTPRHPPQHPLEDARGDPKGHKRGGGAWNPSPLSLTISPGGRFTPTSRAGGAGSEIEIHFTALRVYTLNICTFIL
jgi:hypothetical protein